MSTAVRRPDPSLGPPSGAAGDAPSRTAGDRFVAASVATVAVVLVVLQALAGSVIPPLAVFVAIYFGLAAALWIRSPRWLLAVAGIVAAVHLVGSVPFMLANLAHPESPGSFLTEVFVLLALMVTIAGIVGGFRRPEPRSRRPLLIGAGALAVLAVAVSVVAAATVDSDARQAGDVAITSLASAFPERVEVPAGEAVLWIDNQDPFHHTFLIDGTPIREAMPASAAIRVPIELAPGTYRFYCDVPGHETMQGVLEVS